MNGSRSPLDRGVSGQICQLLESGSVAGLSESQLLERFVATKDEAAFAMLVARHGPMVLGICRRYLSDPNDADDAFQATFLVLARKAGSLCHSELLGNWLHGVACRVAQRARIVSTRQKSRFQSANQVDPSESALGFPARRGDSRESTASDLGPLIHEEVNNLPSKYRSPIVLCYFEGLTHDQAAARLGWPIGTVKGRLSRARDLLRPRLAKRGVCVTSSTLAAALLTSELRAAVPESLIRSTGAAAAAALRGTIASHVGAIVSVPVDQLAKGVLMAMFRAQARSIFTPALLVAGVIVTGTVVVTSHNDSQVFAGQGQAEVSAKAVADVRKSLANESKSAPQGAGRNAGAAEGMGGMMRMMGGGMAGGGGNDSDPNGNRLVIARVAAQIATTDKNPKNLATLKKLDELMTLRYPEPTPLTDLLKRIKDDSQKLDGKPLPLYVDPVGLQEAEKTIESPVVIDLEDVPLRFSLRLALKQLGLAYCVRDGVLIISSVSGIQQELQEALAEQMVLNPDAYSSQMGGSFGGMGGMGGGGMMGGMR